MTINDNVLDRTARPAAADLLAADTSMGAVTLLVADLDLMTAYYRDAVTLTLLAQGEGRSILGRGTTPIVILEHAPALKHAGPRDAGLSTRRSCFLPRRTWRRLFSGSRLGIPGRSPVAPITW